MLSAKYPGFDEEPLEREEVDGVSTRVQPKKKALPGWTTLLGKCRTAATRHFAISFQSVLG
jgi:hypothetical protein